MKRNSILRLILGWGAFLAITQGAVSQPTGSGAPGATFDPGKIQHLVVIYQENWSFDGLYSRFPKANGLTFGQPVRQTDINNLAITTLPQALKDDDNGRFNPDSRFPVSQPVALFDLSRIKNVSVSTPTGDIVHKFYTEQLQIHGGLMDRFVAWSDNPGLVLGAFDATDLPEGRLAQQYVMCDNFFHSAFGGSFLNHQFFISARVPVWPDALTSVKATDFLTHAGAPVFITQAMVEVPEGSNLLPMPKPSLPPAGLKFLTGHNWPPPFASEPRAEFDRNLASGPFQQNDYYVVNTAQPSSWPFDTEGPFLPLLTNPTIGDRLSAAQVSWKWYSGGWAKAVAGHPDPDFQTHHQPFNYYANYAPGQPGRAHLVDLNQFAVDLAGGNLPAVSFVKFQGELNEHPGYADLASGQQATADLVAQIQRSSAWAGTLIIITYDENGGRWDHVAPPVIDGWGPGTRVPTILISPFVRTKFVDHTQYETASILHFIEDRWKLEPLGSRDRKANNFIPAFDPAK